MEREREREWGRGEEKRGSFSQREKVGEEMMGTRPRSASRSEVNLSGNALATRVALARPRPSLPSRMSYGEYVEKPHEI